MSAIKSPTKQRNAGVAMALKVLEEGKRPMSPDQIKGKYGLEFPFTVRRVVSVVDKYSCGCSQIFALKAGAILTFTRIDAKGCYVWAPACENGWIHLIAPDSERFVWTGDGNIKEGSV